jgi:signal transduction histidine kinase
LISLGRLALAAVFLLAIWLDPSQPTRAPMATYSLLAAYMVLAAWHFAATWNNSWLDWRLAVPTHAFDILMFALLVFLTDGYTSPFFTHFIFIILAATIRWGWLETALTALTGILLFFGSGLVALYLADGHLEIQRLVMRVSYLLVLSMILIWIGMNQRPLRSRRLTLAAELRSGNGAPALPLRAILEFVQSSIGARRVLFFWAETEEPWLNVADLTNGSLKQQRFGPETSSSPVSEELADCPFLFNLRSQKALISPTRSGRRIVPLRNGINLQFAEQLHLQEGLVLPVATADYEGYVFALEVPGLCADDLAIGYDVARQISITLERIAMLRQSEESAEARTRLSLARDIHDGVVQLLAGTSFRLEGILRSSLAGREIEPEIRQLQEELSREQRELREFITRLRGAKASARRADICAGLEELAERLRRQWGVECRLATPQRTIEAPLPLEHDLHQLVREAVANAVRHGSAGTIELSVAADEEGIHLTVADDGSGFTVQQGRDDSIPLSGAAGPWSLNERVKSMGGSLGVFSSARGSRVTITLPAECAV